ncbi:DNA-binding protein [Leptolyngbya sp. FACHB-17]|uniref:DNA-binding protein n=1 Tax=unclassified Leptolyngbya TaxID=2650499 RepID=UPI0016803AF6|nr:DNA-binding protein [Leptolyngbya sp. FACHB-17]MBD2079212.1 DNA-binding protein [Leptolyngbya sp. FACHB-17]
MSGKTWYFTNEAAIALDQTAPKLRELYRSGMFKVGYHVRDVSPPNSKRPTLQFHVERCSKQLETPPEKRKQY